MLLDQLRQLLLGPGVYEKCKNKTCTELDLAERFREIQSQNIGIDSVEMLVNILRLNSTMPDSTMSADLPRGQGIVKQCVNSAEQHSEKEIPDWFMHNCTYRGEDYDEKLLAQRLRRRWSIPETVSDEALELKCVEALKDLTDHTKNRKLRESKLVAADKKKDSLIARYAKKPSLTQSDKDYLLSEGVIVDQSGKFIKTQDKLLDLKWHNVNPANVDANEWGMDYIKKCRDSPSKYLEQSQSPSQTPISQTPEQTPKN